MEIVLPKPYPAQIPVFKACFDNETFFITLNGSRQVGKTVVATIAAIKWALSEPNQNVMIASPTDKQVRKIYKQTLVMCKPLMQIVKTAKASAGDAEIVFINESSIIFRSAKSDSSLRGDSVTHMILDECAFMKEETWNMVLSPMLTVTGKKCLFCSTPKGNNFFARLYNDGLDETKTRYKSFKLTYHNNPFVNIDFIEERRLTIPDEIFRQEYLGEFIDAAGCFSNLAKVATLSKASYSPTNQYYIGVDIALKGDYTVAICFNQNQEMVDYIRFNQTEIVQLTTNLKNFFNKWKPRTIKIESNNQGLPIIQTLQSQGVRNIIPFNTTVTSKHDIINQLIAACGKEEVKLLNDPILVNEFNAFTATLTKTGSIKFAAAYGHDDIVMATAIAFECITKTKYHKAFTIGRR